MLKLKALEKYTDEELQDELNRRYKARLAEQRKKYDVCEHDWRYWSDYYGKGRDCQKCGKQE